MKEIKKKYKERGWEQLPRQNKKEAVYLHRKTEGRARRNYKSEAIRHNIRNSL